MPQPAPSPPPFLRNPKLSHRTYGRRGKMVLERLGESIGDKDRPKSRGDDKEEENGNGSGSATGDSDESGEMEVELPLPPKGTSRDVGESSPLTSPPPEDFEMGFVGNAGVNASGMKEDEEEEGLDITPKAKKRSRAMEEGPGLQAGSETAIGNGVGTFQSQRPSSPSHKRQKTLPSLASTTHKPAPLPITTTTSRLSIPTSNNYPAHSLITPPETEFSKSIRQRQAAHTPKTPPRDLQEVLGRREASPSPVGVGAAGGKERVEGGGGKEGDGGDRSGGGSGGGGASGASGTLLGLKSGAFPGRRPKRKMMTRTESLGEKEPLFGNSSSTAHSPISGPSNSTSHPATSHPTVTFNNESFLLKSPDRRHSTLPTTSASNLPTTPPRLGKSHSTDQVTVTPTGSPSRNPSGRSGSGSIPNSPSSRPVLRQAYSTSTALAAMSGNANAGVGLGAGMGLGGGRTVRTYGRRQNAMAVVEGSSNGHNNGNNAPAASTARIEAENEREEQLLRPLNGERPVPVHQDSYAELNKRYGIDVQEEEDTQDSQGSAADMKVPAPLAELRSRGENRRFMDDLGYLRDGLRDDSLAARRDSAIDIINQCTDLTWYDRLRVCGQLDTILSDLLFASSQESDKALSIAVVLYLGRVAGSAHDLDALLLTHSEEIVGFLVRVVSERDAVFDMAGVEVKRKKASAMETLRTTAQKVSGIGSGSRQALSPLAISAELLIRCLNNDDALIAGGRAEDVVSTTRAVAFALRRELDGLKPRIESYKQGLDMFTPSTIPDFAFVSRCVQLLVTLCEQTEAVKPVLGDESSVLAAHFADLLLIISHEIDTPSITAQERSDLTENLLKLVVAVMQTVPSWAERFLSGTAPYMALTRFLSVERRPQPIRERSVSPAGSEATETSENDQADPTESTDTSLTHLALGCMYNLVEEDKAAGTSLSSIYIGQPCQGSFRCLMQCRCPQRISAPEQILRLLAYQQEHKAEDPHASFLSGFLAILMARISEHSADARTVIHGAVPGDTLLDKYQYLLDIVNEFKITYRDFQSQLTKGVRKQLGLDQDEGFEVVINDSIDTGNIARAVQIYEAFIQDV